MAKIKAKLSPEQKKLRAETRRNINPQTGAAMPANAVAMKPYSTKNLDRTPSVIFNDYMLAYDKLGRDKMTFQGIMGMSIIVWNTVSENPAAKAKQVYEKIEELSDTKVKFMQKFIIRSMVRRRKKKFGQYDFHIAEPKLKEKDGIFSVQVSAGKPI